MPPHYLTAHSPHALGTSTPLWVIPVPRVPFPIFLIIPISSHLHSKHQSVSCSVHDLPSEPIHDLLNLFYHLLPSSMLPEAHLHMPPDPLEMLHRDGHVLVDGAHVFAGVVVGSAEEHGEELGDGVVEFGDVADVLEVEDVDLVVAEDGLVEVGDDLLEFGVAAQPVVEGHGIWIDL